MELRLNTQDVWNSALIFAFLDLLILVPLVLVFREDLFERALLPIGATSAFFWGVLAIVAIFGFWDLYYQYFTPGWARWLAPLDALLYGAIGLFLWWLALRIPGLSVLWFVLLGGVEGILEHLLGIYAMHILDKVPWLQGLPPYPVLVFSFFEYIFYWSLVAWLTLGLVKLFRI